jgi:hypothetical protein
MKLPIPKIKTGDSTNDKIWASFLSDSVKLSKTNEKLRDRLLIVWKLRLKMKTSEQAFNIYARIYNLSRAQFFRDTKRADTIFGDLLETSQKAKKAIYAEMILGFLEQCKKKGDRDNMAKGLKLLGDSWQVNMNDSLTHNPEKLEDKPIKLSISKASAELLAATLSKGTADFNKIIDAEAETVE